MAVGNLGADQAQQDAMRVADALSPTLIHDQIPELVPLQAEPDLPTLVPTTSREESVVLRYLQAPDRSLQSQARLAVLGQLLDTPFYQRLRTEEQLGYVVSAGYSPLLDAPGISLLVQSPDTRSEAIQGRIDAFLDDFTSRLEGLEEADLAAYRQAVRDQLLQRDTSLSGRTNRFWQATALDDADFLRREKLAERVLDVNPQELHQAWSALRNDGVVNVAFDPGDEPNDVAELSRKLTPLPKGEE
jgi:secreted Zn-dependent insulinase-like peptidase